MAGPLSIASQSTNGCCKTLCYETFTCAECSPEPSRHPTKQCLNVLDNENIGRLFAMIHKIRLVKEKRVNCIRYLEDILCSTIASPTKVEVHKKRRRVLKQVKTPKDPTSSFQ